jgi:actin-related protein
MDKAPVVIDNGTKCCKIGFSSEDNPRAVVPTTVGVSRVSKDAAETVGEEPLKRRDLYNIVHPIQRGIIQDLDNMEKIWHYAFYNELRIPPEEHPVLHTEPALNPKSNREKIAQVMFETFNVPATKIALQPSLTLISTGRTNGIVLDSGEGVTSIVPICEGMTLSHAMLRFHLSGIDLTDYLQRLMTERGYYLDTPSEQELIPDIKEQLSYVALDFNEEMSATHSSAEIEKQYEMPDGRMISLGNERFRCGEALFQPSLVGLPYPGFHQGIYNSINKCDMAIRRDLYSNIVASGGTTLLSGFMERLEKELLSISSSSLDIKAIGTPERKYSVWIGGSILTSLTSFQDMWILKKDYEEKGPSVLHND